MKRYHDAALEHIGLIEIVDSLELAKHNEALERIYKTAEDFLQSEVSSVVNNGEHSGSGNLKYLGNLIVMADPRVINRNTKEFREDVYRKLLGAFGKQGYDDPDRLKGAMAEVGGLIHPGRDHDGGLALDPEYNLWGAGCLVKQRDELIEEWGTSKARKDSDRIKKDRVGFKHMFGWMFSKMGSPDASSVVLSDSGESIIAYKNGKIWTPDSLYDEYNTIGLDDTKPPRNESKIFFFPPSVMMH